MTESACAEPRLRLLIALSVGIAEAILKFTQSASAPSDFGQVWFAARAALAGHDPYSLVGPGLAFDWPYPLVYPMTAAAAALPLAVLSLPLAKAVFCGVAAGLLAWALSRWSYWPLLALCSDPVFAAFKSVQWSPIFAAAVVLPPLSFLLAAKPTIGLAIFAARPSWWAVIGAIVLGAVAFVLRPDWLSGWSGAIQQNAVMWAPAHPYRFPILLPGGVITLACLARWRRPEARLVLALACVPQTLWLYDTVPLWLVPRTALECVTFLLLGIAVSLIAPSPANGLASAATLDTIGRACVALLYVPCVAMVLRRPNEGTIPARLEQRIATWPAWLRGA